MEEFKAALKVIIPILLGFFIIVQCIFLVVGPDYKKGEYTMVYKVYYPGNPRTYTIKNEWPIGLSSYKGTNAIQKEMESPFLKKAFTGVTVFETTAPIEVVSYTYKEKE